HLDRGSHRLVQVSGGGRRLDARPRQTLQVADDASAVQRRLTNGGDGLARRRLQLIGMQQLDLTQDGGKQVVEIVRYARRHLADGAQLLRVQQLRVQAPRLGDLGVDVD